MSLTNKEGKEIKCSICKGSIEDQAWAVIKFTKKIRTVACGKCGKPIRIEYNAAKDNYEIEARCACKLNLAASVLENSSPKWERRVYHFCDKCFKANFANPVFYAELGEALP